MESTSPDDVKNGARQGRPLDWPTTGRQATGPTGKREAENSAQKTLWVKKKKQNPQPGVAKKT